VTIHEQLTAGNDYTHHRLHKHILIEQAMKHFEQILPLLIAPKKFRLQQQMLVAQGQTNL